MKTLIIAEAGVNHDGSLEKAKELVRVSKKIGADVVKFQTFSADALVTKSAPKAEYQTRLDGSKNQHEMLQRLQLSNEAFVEIKKECERVGIEFLSTPFDTNAAEFLVKELHVKRLKLGSGEITNGPLLHQCGTYGLPLILSTGTATLGDIERALMVLAHGYFVKEKASSWNEIEEAYFSKEARALLSEKVIILQCTTEYPAPDTDLNLNTLSTLKEAFGCSVGFSDHSKGIGAAAAAVALGAVAIEKHITLDRTLPGPDHQASLEPAEFQQMVAGIRAAEAARGSFRKFPTTSDLKNAPVARKSLVAVRAIAPGQAFNTENLGSKRPGTGISPMRYWDFLDRTSDRDYLPDHFLTEKDPQ